ncbi:MAG TPA: helix-turn-helix transcriptional regulator [Streptosporangiaceae bacterium]|nr:helix-turn-helix transcriptional regulator [Streptosporangiaceae bacterium]
MSDFGAELGRLHRQRGLSLHALSRLSHYDAGYLSKVVNGHKRGSRELALEMERHLCADGALIAAWERSVRPSVPVMPLASPEPDANLPVVMWLERTIAGSRQVNDSLGAQPPPGPFHSQLLAGILGAPPHLLWFKLPAPPPGPEAAHPSSLHGQARAPSTGDRSLSAPSADLYSDQRLHQLVTGRSDSVDRREFIEAGLGVVAAAATPAAGLLDSLSHTPIPVEVREHDIQQVLSAARIFTSWDHTYGGGIVREAVTAQLRWSARLLETDCPERLRPALFSAVGYLSGVCGAMAFDAYAHDDARRMFAFGFSCAEVANDWHYRAKVLSLMARQATWCGQPDNGLTYAELALVRADRLTHTEQAMLHTARARALAKLGRVQETLTAVGRADEVFARSQPEVDPPWMTYYDHAQHQGDTGHALFDLALDGPPEPAIQRLTDAVNGHPDAYARSRAFSGIKLATLIMVKGDPTEASAIGQRAMEDAGRVRSRRVADTLRELRSAASRHGRDRAAADLRDRVSTLIGAA